MLKAWLCKALAPAGAFPTPRTPPDRLRSLLRNLYPLATGKPLVRLGSAADGGYLVPDDLAEITACFSPGVSDRSEFERDCADLGMRVFMADKSVERPPGEYAHFIPKFIGAISNHDFMTLDHWVDSSIRERHTDLLLQMDIEGYEYETLIAASDALVRRFRIMVVEFHRLDHLWSLPFFNLAARAFDKILQNHACVHLHPNNCCGSLKTGGVELPLAMEFTFLRRDRITQSVWQTAFPHPLDRDNTPKKPLPLPGCWFQTD